MWPNKTQNEILSTHHEAFKEEYEETVNHIIQSVKGKDLEERKQIYYADALMCAASRETDLLLEKYTSAY